MSNVRGKKNVHIYDNKTRKKESVVSHFQIKLEEIQICELLGLISHTNMLLEHQRCLFQACQTNSMHLKVILVSTGICVQLAVES